MLIIGASGFLGGYIVEKCLREGYNVRAGFKNILDEKYRQHFPDNVEWVPLDILNLDSLREAMEGMDIVVNTAAMVTFDSSRKKEAFSLARDGTTNILEVAVEYNIRKFIHVSSVAAIGRKKMENYIDEKVIFSHSPYDTVYGLSKFLAEQEVWRAYYEGLPVTILNPSFILGASFWGKSSTKIFTSLKNGLRYFPVGITGFVDVRDVADAVVKSFDEKFNGERFIISAENVSYESVFKKIHQTLKLPQKLKPLSPSLTGIAWRWAKITSFFNGKEAIITKDKTISTKTLSYYDNTKSKDVLGLSYKNIQETLVETSLLYLNDVKNNNAFSFLPNK